jgi:predicted amidohydrolase
MPKVYEYKCNQCDFDLGWGWGGHLFVIDDKGERIVCNHPGEEGTIIETLGAVRFWNKKKMLW